VDIAKGEATEKELDQLIARRSQQKDPDEEHALWLASERLHNARREAEDRAARLAYHERQAARLRHALGDLVARHEAEAEKCRSHRQEGDAA
jgi:hypothetical protein